MSPAVSKKIVDLHNGDLSVSSAGEGFGSTFTLSLGICEKDEDENCGEEESVHMSLPSRSHQDQNYQRVPFELKSDPAVETFVLLRKALIVDDSGLNRKMTRLNIAGDFAEVMEAGDGDEAVAIFESTIGLPVDIDVIIMDFEMPRMNGPTATKLIRGLGYNGIILGATGNALPDDIRTFTASGADDVLVKPINLQMIRNSIACKFCTL
jgi:CheY-like chemotaxis protein